VGLKQPMCLCLNKFTTVPDPLKELIEFQALDPGNNPLVSLPEWLGQLTKLQRLLLSSTVYTFGILIEDFPSRDWLPPSEWKNKTAQLTSHSIFNVGTCQLRRPNWQ